MGRAPCCEKVGLKKGRWSREEDEILVKYIKEHGEGSWRSLPKKAGLLRCGKSCRLRWINYLREDLKRGNISVEEEEMIVKLHATLGNRWSLIAGHLPGRTDNEIKNYWNSHLSRRANDFRKEGSDTTTVTVDLSKLPGGGKRRGGRRSRAAAKEKEKENSVNSVQVEHKEDQGSPSGASSLQPSSVQSEEQAQASSVTFDGLEEGPLGLSEEMMSRLLAPESQKLESGPNGPGEGVSPELDDLTMGWDLMGLDGIGDDDMWGSLVWNYEDVLLAPHEAQQVAMPDLFLSETM